MARVCDENLNKFSEEEAVKKINKRKSYLKNCARQFKAFGKVLLGKKYRDIPIFLEVSYESYTDHQKIQASISPEEAVCFNNHEVIMALKVKVSHETQHIHSTVSKNFKDCIMSILEMWEEEASKQKLVLNKNRAMEIAHFIVNGIEDGRIERILFARKPQLRDYYLWYRGNEWLESEIKDKSLPELITAVNQCHKLATMGIYQKNFENIYHKGDNIYDKVEKLKPIVFEAVSSERCKGCMEKCYEIAKELTPEVISLLTITEQDMEMMKQLKKMMEQVMNESGSYQATEEREETNSDHSQQGLFTFPSDEEQEKAASSGDKEDGSQGNSKEKKKSKSSGLENSEDASENKPIESEKNETSESSFSEKEKEGANESNSNNSKLQNNKSLEDGLEKPAQQQKSSEDGLEKPAQQQKSSEDGLEKPAQQQKSLEEKIKEAIENSSERASREADKMAKAIEVEQKKEKAENKRANENNVTKSDIADIIDGYKDDSWTDFEEKINIHSVKSPASDDLALINKYGRVLSRAVNIEMKNKQSFDQRQMKSGKLDIRSIHKLPLGNGDVFMKKGSPSKWDGCAYILKDGSGSMSGNKNYEACKALAIIENGIKETMPLKITEFCTRGQTVTHNVIKNWDENSKNKNYSWDYYNNHYPNGGNKDGYSIRVATKELLRRGEEQKMLIIISDGIPSAYLGSNGFSDVHSAVQEARKKGIFVIAIYIGEVEYIENNKKNYENMYEKDYIGATPEKLPKELTRIFKKFVKAY